MKEYKSDEYQIKKYDKSQWKEYEKIELAWFAQDAKDCYAEICKELGLIRMSELKTILKTIQELRIEAERAQTVLDDWVALNRHMEENPTIREEWEGILMAIRLTEEE